MEFRCRLATDAGEVLDRVRTAESEAALRTALESEGLHLLSLRRRWRVRRPAGPIRRGRIGGREFIVFNQELAALLRAGLPLVPSIDLLRQRTDQPALAALLDDVQAQLRGGAALSDAFGRHAARLPGIYIATVLAGERSGGLEAALRRYVGYARVISGVRRRTLSALIYPAILLALSGAVVGIIVVRVVPEFTRFYEGMGASLPWITRLLTAVSGAVVRFFWPLLAAAAAAGGAAWAWAGTDRGRTQLDRLLLRTPVVGGVARAFMASQGTRTLATLIEGGLPLVAALDVTTRSIGNRYAARHLAAVAGEVREGGAFAAALARRALFPPVAVRMVEVGESTGALPEMLHAAADFFDEEIETTLGRLLTLLEPVLLVVMGLVIAGLLLALYWPLLQLGAIAS